MTVPPPMTFLPSRTVPAVTCEAQTFLVSPMRTTMEGLAVASGSHSLRQNEESPTQILGLH